MEIESSKDIIQQVIEEFEGIEDLDYKVIFTKEFVSKFTKYRVMNGLADEFVRFLDKEEECEYYGNGSFSMLLDYSGNYELDDFIEMYTVFKNWDEFYNSAVSYYFTKMLSSRLLTDLSKCKIDVKDLSFQTPVLCTWTDLTDDEDDEEEEDNDWIPMVSETADKCPNCGSANVIRIIYGLPTAEAGSLAEKGKIKLGGCCITGNDPTHYCTDCKCEFKTTNNK
jgi:hypothetical protein